MFVLLFFFYSAPLRPPVHRNGLWTEINCSCCLWTSAGHVETKKVTSFIGDICEPTEEAIGQAFRGVDCVFHCAAFIDFQFPPNYSELERVNVQGKWWPTISFNSPRRDFVLFTATFFFNSPLTTHFYRFLLFLAWIQYLPLVRLITDIIIR